LFFVLDSVRVFIGDKCVYVCACVRACVRVFISFIDVNREASEASDLLKVIEPCVGNKINERFVYYSSSRTWH
jgi:hypothetical protein